VHDRAARSDDPHVAGARARDRREIGGERAAIAAEHERGHRPRLPVEAQHHAVVAHHPDVARPLDQMPRSGTVVGTTAFPQR
jgi:hypothetical protein